MGGESQNGIDLPTRGIVYQRCEHRGADARFEKNFAEGARFRNADAELFHQPRGKRTFENAPLGIRKSQAAAFGKNR